MYTYMPLISVSYSLPKSKKHRWVHITRSSISNGKQKHGHYIPKNGRAKKTKLAKEGEGGKMKRKQEKTTRSAS